MVKANLPTGYFLILVGIAVGYRPSKQALQKPPSSVRDESFSTGK